MKEVRNPAPLPDADGHNSRHQPERPFPEGSLGRRAYHVANAIFASRPNTSFVGTLDASTDSGRRLFIHFSNNNHTGDNRIVIRRWIGDGPETLLIIRQGVPEMITEDYNEEGSVVEDPAEALLFLRRVARDLRGLGRLPQGTALPSEATTDEEVTRAAQTIADTMQYNYAEQDVTWQDLATGDFYSAKTETRKVGTELRAAVALRRVTAGAITIDGISEDGATTAVRTTEELVFRDWEPEGRHMRSREIVEPDDVVEEVGYTRVFGFNAEEFQRRYALLVEDMDEVLPHDTVAISAGVTHFEGKATELQRAYEEGTQVASEIDTRNFDAPLLLEDNDILFAGFSSSEDSFVAPSHEEPDDPSVQFPDAHPHELDDR